MDVSAVFELSDPDLLDLVSNGAAEYVLLVKSPKTHFRKELRSNTPVVEESFKGELSGRVEFSPFLICVESRSGFIAKGWHSDFTGLAFDLMPGFVLAEDKPRECWIDGAEEAPIGTIFEQRRGGKRDGYWECHLDGDRVGILLSDADSRRFRMAREKANDTPDAQYLMNGLFLPVLIHVLNEADKNEAAYAEYRWYDALNNRLEAVGCKSLGADAADRSVDAQKVFEYPFVKMPMVAGANGEWQD